MILSKMTKTQYSEAEAASALGVTVHELRALIRKHIAGADVDSVPPLSVFEPSDVVILKLLTGRLNSSSV
jgi:hypothetical protein